MPEMADVEMAEAKVADVTADSKDTPPALDFDNNAVLIEEAVRTKEPRSIVRALRNLVSIRARLNVDFLTDTVLRTFDSTHPLCGTLLAVLNQAQAAAVSSQVKDDKAASRTKVVGCDLVELHTFVQLMIIEFLMDSTQKQEAMNCATALVEFVTANAQISLDPLAARAHYVWALCCEQTGNGPNIRPALLAAHRTATLRHDKIGQATLHNLIMRNYVESSLYEQADNFNSKTSFPEVNPNETSRHLYYLGRIRAIQLEYSEAYMSLLQASRKCPQQKALGFRTVVSKWLIVVQLLMGEVPERPFFNQAGLRVPLEPYLALTQAVRLGNLEMFNKVGADFAAVFAQDKIQNLIVRLRHNVIKAGLRMINVSYSRISLEDICAKLQFDSLEATSCIVAKAIRDGVVDGIIDYDGAFLQSNESNDVYATEEPYKAFRQRIRFCMGIHDDAVKAMRYPENAHKDSFESAEERLQREKEEAELANTLAEDDGSDDEM
jgi:26S proteasome regulatory subunit N3